MDQFSIDLALSQGGQAEVAAQNALNVSFGGLGAANKSDKPFPFMGLFLAGLSVGAVLWFLRR